MKKEFILFLIGFGIICLNIPIVLLFYFFNSDLMGIFFTIIVPLECIMIGLIGIYCELQERKNKRREYKVCDGIIKNTTFKLVNSNWIKTSVVSYNVDGKNYEVTSNVGINGIFSFFIKNKKIKFYYKEDNPENIILNNNVSLIVGTMFIVVGILILII